jgi:SulP family sulfate permease
MARKENPTTHNLDFPKVSKPPFAMSEAFHNSPRRTHVTAAGVSNLPDGVANSPNHLAPVSGEHKTGSSKSNHGHSSGSSLTLKQPLPILLQTFSDYFDDSEQTPHDFFYNIVPYLSPVHTKAGETIWERDEMADALYLIESGCLRATYEYEDHCELIQETMVAGTVAGELTMLSASKRNATVVAERDSKLWKLDQKGLEKMEKERPEIARRFVKIVLKGELAPMCLSFCNVDADCRWVSVIVANEEADVLFNHLVAVLS